MRDASSNGEFHREEVPNLASMRRHCDEDYPLPIGRKAAGKAMSQPTLQNKKCEVTPAAELGMTDITSLGARLQWVVAG